MASDRRTYMRFRSSRPIGRETVASLVVLAVLASGCGAHYQVLMNPQGQIVTCQTSAVGLISFFVSDYLQAECINARRAEGFTEIRLSGAIGADFDKDLAISDLVAGGPAESVGMRIGDTLVSIDGKQSFNLTATNRMLAGPPGATVEIVCERHGKHERFRLTRRPWIEVYGKPK